MDILGCVGLVVCETAFLLPLSAGRGVAPLRAFSALFLAHYVVLKLYRIVIYPTFLSPLRHLPGPKASLLSVRGTPGHSPSLTPPRITASS